MRLKITSNGTTHGTNIVDTDTEQELDGILRVEIAIDGREDDVQCVIHTESLLDVVIEKPQVTVSASMEGWARVLKAAGDTCPLCLVNVPYEGRHDFGCPFRAIQKTP